MGSTPTSSLRREHPFLPPARLRPGVQTGQKGPLPGPGRSALGDGGVLGLGGAAGSNLAKQLSTGTRAGGSGAPAQISYACCPCRPQFYPVAHLPMTAVTTERRQERREGTRGGRAGSSTHSAGEAGRSQWRAASQPASLGTCPLSFSCVHHQSWEGAPLGAQPLVCPQGTLTLGGDTQTLSSGPAPAESRGNWDSSCLLRMPRALTMKNFIPSVPTPQVAGRLKTHADPTRLASHSISQPSP